MAETKDIPAGTYELQLGSTFFDSGGRDREKKTMFHTLRYDFKPRSVANAESETYVAFGGNGDVQIAVPTEGDNLTVYKGPQKPVKDGKECVLFFDHRTNTVRLEKINSNINVKKTRDTDPAVEGVLRSEISRLRGQKLSPAEFCHRESEVEVFDVQRERERERERERAAAASRAASSSGGSSGLPRGDSSSDSSSSDSDSDSDSDTDDENKRARKSSQSGGDSDEDLTNALEMELARATQPPPMPAPRVESMPSLSAPRPPSKETGLFDDLQLSESSDED